MSDRSRLSKVSPAPGQKPRTLNYSYVPCPRSEEVGTGVLLPLTHKSPLQEERCSAMGSLGGAGWGSSGEAEPPQPLVDRRPSAAAAAAAALVSWAHDAKDRGDRDSQGNYGMRARVVGRTEPISLATLDRDCFIIPVHSLDRFLPDGVPLPLPPLPSEKGTGGSLGVLEVPDPKLCILAHLMSPLEPVDPALESPLARPLARQRAAALELLNEIGSSGAAVGGMLLANMERHAEFPFIAYYVINACATDPLAFYGNLRGNSLSKFDPRATRYTAAHTLDLYGEVAAIARPPLLDPALGLKRLRAPATGYIVSVYKVFEGDDGERFERNWLYWTGARMLYRHLPRSAGLRRIALHKSVAERGDKMYLLVCECANLLDDISCAAYLVPALRARLCGYTGLYRPVQAF